MVAICHSYVSKNSYGNKQQENSCGSNSSEDDVMVVAILGRLGRWQKEQELWHHHTISSGIVMALGRLLAGASAWLEP